MAGVLFSASALFALVPPALAQGSPALDPGRIELTRQDLMRLQSELEEVVGSPVYSPAIRDRARRDLVLVRERLTNGDFRPGDRIFVVVSGHVSDTLTVEGGPRVVLPSLGPVSLAGVLRSELHERVSEMVGSYIRDPHVRTESLIRLSVQGMVGSPGFYTVPAGTLLSDVLMHAGGPDRSADLERIRIERSGEVLWEGKVIQEMLVEGRTLDQMNLRAGDQIVLPERRQNVLVQIARYGAIVGSTILLGTRIF